MGDTVELKEKIRNIVKELEIKYNTEFSEVNILKNNPESRKYHGVSNDKSICLFVCNNELQDGKIKAGQRASIFEKCYWLSLSDTKNRLLVFTDKDFYNKFKYEYSEYLKDIEVIYFNL